MKIPADFPKDVPVPAGATVTEAKTRPNGTRHLVFEVKGTVPATVEYYVKELAAKGWEIGAQKVRGAAGTVMADKGERTAAIGVFDRGAVRQVTIEVDPEKH